MQLLRKFMIAIEKTNIFIGKLMDDDIVLS